MTNAAGKNPTIAQCHLLGKQDWKNTLMCPFSPAASNVLVSPPKLWQAGHYLCSQKAGHESTERTADCSQLSP